MAFVKRAGESAGPTYAQYAAIRRYQGGLSFSPDGAWVAYSVNTSGQYNLWKQPSAGGFPEQVTLSASESVREISWSPDGASIAYTADADGTEVTKVHLLSANGGIARVVDTGDEARCYFDGNQVWSPDGKQLVFAANDRAPEEQDLVLLDANTGQTRRLLQDGGLYYPKAWSPDGSKLAAANEVSNTRADALVVDVATGEAKKITPAGEGEDGLNIPVGWSPDGNHVFVVTNMGREFLGLASVPAQGGERTMVLDPDWDLDAVDVSADGRWLMYAVNEDGYSRLFIRDQQGDGDDREISMPAGVCGSTAMSPDGGRVAVLWAQPTNPSEIFIIDVATGDVTQITKSALGGVAEDWLTTPELVRYPSFDRDIPAWVYNPSHADSKLPVVLSIHGGPEAQERPTYIYSGLYQYLCSQGIAVVAPNIRGSTGYGKSYQKLIHRDWGGDELRDLEAAAKWIRAQEWVDPDRVAVYGGSFGGFATLSCMTRLPEYWACGVDLVGPANLITFARAVPPTWKRMMADWVGDPEADREMLAARSPITYVDQLTAPLYVIQGANDPRVVKSESDQIVEKLRARGVDVTYDVYEDEGHGFTKRENDLKANSDTAQYLIDHLVR